MTLLQPVIRATTISAESHVLPSNVNSWLHGLPVDDKQLGGGHLAPQALNGSELSMAFQTLAFMCINLLCLWDLNGRSLQHTQVTLCKRQQLAEGQTAWERQCEKRGPFVLSKLQVAGKKGSVYWQA